VVYDSDTGANRIASNRVGCFSHRAIAETPRGTLFPAFDGHVYRTDGNSFNRLSEAIYPTLRDGLDISEGARVGSPSVVNGAFFRDHYYLCYLPTGANPVTVDYDFATESWWMHSFGFRAATPFQDDADTPDQLRLFLGVQLAGVGAHPNVARLSDQSVDNLGTTFTPYWKAGGGHSGRPEVRKRLRGVHFTGRGSGSLKCEVFKDYSSSAEAASETIALASATEGHLPTPGTGRLWAPKFSALPPFTIGLPPELHEYTMLVEPRTA
jgi:hypothetical protein